MSPVIAYSVKLLIRVKQLIDQWAAIKDCFVRVHKVSITLGIDTAPPSETRPMGRPERGRWGEEERGTCTMGRRGDGGGLDSTGCSCTYFGMHGSSASVTSGCPIEVMAESGLTDCRRSGQYR